MHIGSSDKLNRLFELSFDLICVANTEGFFEEVNPAFERTLGWSKKELLSKSFLDFIHPEDVAPTLDEIEQLKAGRPAVNFINRYLCKNGSYKWLSWISHPTNEGMLYAIARDITEQIKKEQKIVEDKKRIQYLYKISALSSYEIERELNSILKSIAELLNLEIGLISKIEKDKFKVFEVHHPLGSLKNGQELSLKNTYCKIVVEEGKTVAIPYMKESHYTEHPCYQIFSLESYLGALIKVDDKIYGTISFSGTKPRAEFSEEDIQLVELAAYWIGGVFERRIKNEKLEKNTFLLQEFEKMGNVGGWEIDLKDQSMFWSDEVYRIHELPLNTKIDVESGINFYHSDDQPIIKDAFKNLVHSGKEYDLELRLITARKNEIWVRAKGSAIYENDRIIKVRGIFQNIDRQVKTRQELAFHKERLDLAVRGTNDGIWDWMDVSSDEEWWSPRFYELLGYKNRETPSTLKTFENLLHPDDKERAFHAVTDCFEKNIPFDIEYRLKLKNGKYKWFRGRANVIRDDDGNPLRMAGSIRDIHTTKEAEEQLRNSEEKFRFLFEDSPIGLALVEMDGTFIDANQSYLDIIGYGSIKEINQLSYWDLTPRKYYEDEILQLKSIEKNGRYGPYEKEYIRKDGSLIPVLLNGVVVMYSDGVKRLWSTVENITERKNSERALKNTNEELRQLAYIMSHDMKTPIANIESFLTFLKKDNAITNKRSQFAITAIDASVEQSKKTIMELINVIKQRDVVLEYEDIRFEKVYYEVIKNLEKDIQAIKPLINYDFSMAPNVCFSYIHITSVMQNILSNALKYHEADRRLHINVYTKKTKDYTCLYVEDNGIGINLEKDKEKVFGLFKRANNSVKGSGLGLYMIKQMLEREGGKIEVESEFGKGSTFVIFFKK